MRQKILWVWLLIGSPLLASCPTAHAQWLAHASQPDVFGNRTVLAVASAGSGDGLTIQCNQKDSLELAYIFPATAKDLDEMSNGGSVPVTLLLKVDNGEVMKLSAAMQPWNNTYAGFVVSGRDYTTVQAIKEIQNSQSNISVGVDLMGNQQSDNFSPIGSTTAMSTVIQDCQLGNIKAPPPGSGQTQGSGNN